MGGKAFKHLHVPRLSPVEYQKISTEVRLLLETMFNQVAIPREAPGKATYGDIDFLVGGIREAHDAANIVPALVDLLGAEDQIGHSYALRHPYVSGAHVQADVEFVHKKDAELFDWQLFMKSDSDLNQIIATLHSSIGLICNDKGLHVRVKEVQEWNKKFSEVFLTRDVDDALDFFGYDKSKYHQGFGTENEIFDWVTSGRFFHWKIYDDRIDTAKERNHKKERPMYGRFVDEYLPTCGKATLVHNGTDIPNGGKAKQAVVAQPSRQEVLVDALRTFDKQEEYDALISEFKNQGGMEEVFWKNVTASLPQPFGVTISALRKWVAFRDGRPYIADIPFTKKSKIRWTDHFSLDDLDDILAWVEKNRDEVRKREEDRLAAAQAATAMPSSAGTKSSAASP